MAGRCYAGQMKLLAQYYSIKDCDIGEDTIVRDFVNLYGCRIGRECRIAAYVEIQRGVVIGDRVKVEAFAFIPTGVTIEDEVFIGPRATFTNDGGQEGRLHRRRRGHRVRRDDRRERHGGRRRGGHQGRASGSGGGRQPGPRYQEEVSKMNKIPVSRPTVTDEMVEAMADAVRNERMVLGESVFKFEEEFARYTGTKHAISVSSGTDALVLTLIALNVRGKEVITSPLSFIATANSIVHAGATPVFADSSPKDLNIDPAEVRTMSGTAAIMPVHLFGQPARMDELREAVGEKVKIIEDACQAHGAVYKGKKAGSIGDAGCFSFYATKNMTVGGDGGMITTNDERLAADLRKLRDCGRTSRYVHDIFGFTARLNTANAAFGRVQLRNLDGWNERRRAIARRYAEKLRDVPEVILPPMGNRDITPVFHLFVVRAEDRDALARSLQSRDIETAVHYPVPIHLQPVYRDAFGYSPGSYPESERLADRVLSLPVFPTLADEDVDRVCEAIIDHYGGKI